jgi:hypothetical protein
MGADPTTVWSVQWKGGGTIGKEGFSDTGGDSSLALRFTAVVSEKGPTLRVGGLIPGVQGCVESAGQPNATDARWCPGKSNL